MMGVKNFDGILGADIFKSPGFTAAALNLGDWLFEGAEIIGPGTFYFFSNTETDVSYLPGPTS